MSISRAENTPSVLSSKNATTTFQTRNTMAANAANTMAAALAEEGIAPQADGTTNLKTPDYHLPFTGPTVEDALWKIINLDLHDVGGTTIVDSSPDAPANLDTMTTPGNYVFEYAQSATFPEGLVGVTILNMSVYKDKDGNLIQILEGAGQKYYRYSKDQGNTWSQFAVKSTGDPINTAPATSEPPPKDPVTQVKDDLAATDKKVADIDKKVTDLAKSVTDVEANIKKSMLSLGTTADGTKIVNGTYDYG